MGATAGALGDTRPDNTSAIIALQRAAATPSEITKQNLYQSIEDLYRIYIEVMADNGGRIEEDYIDLIPILENLYISAHDYVRPIKKVELNYA